MYLRIKLEGGLCNKLYCLFSACEIAIDKQLPIINPAFGWKKPILFSEIYDIEHFNNAMRPHNKGLDLIILDKNIPASSVIIDNVIDLWKHSCDRAIKQRIANTWGDLEGHVLDALKINPKYEHVLDAHIIQTAFHVRIETDWVKYNTQKRVLYGETLLIDINTLITMFLESDIPKNRVFFTTGEAHTSVRDHFKKNDIAPTYFFDPTYEYELNAAINFFICSKSDHFIGISRSTFSNLVTFKRALLNRDSSYIYNMHNTIYRRTDKGLHCDPLKSIHA